MAAIKALPIDDRVDLVHAIIETIDEEVENTPLTPAQIADLERRLEAYRKNPDDCIPWEQVEAEARARWGE
jgi:putative addiction module component (TIGR02574 family)